MLPDAHTAERRRDHQRSLWSAAAVDWQRDYGPAILPIDAISEQLLALARVAPGQRVLDLCCGAGNPAFFIAQRVGDAGTVLGLDLSDVMVRGTAAQAARLGLASASFRAIASERDLGVAEGAFDAATCRHGLMFMPDPLGALRALYAALKPEGRIAISTWAGLERCPSFAALIDAMVRHADLSPAAVDELALPFTALSEPEALVDLLNEAGFGEVAVTLVEQWHEPESAAAHWDHTTPRVASMRALLAAQPEDVRAAMRQDAIASIRAQCGDAPIRLLATALVVGATKPA